MNNCIQGLIDWIKSPIKETKYLLQYLFLKISRNVFNFRMRKQIKYILLLTNKAILTNERFRSDLSRAGIYVDNPIVVEVNALHETVFIEQEGNELVTSWRNIASLFKKPTPWGEEGVWG